MLKDSTIGKLWHKAVCYLDCAAPIGDLLLRLWVANIFWKAGLTKIANIDTTLFLFQHEYAVPILPYQVAAYMAIGAELILPVLLVFGLAGRISAGALFLFNAMAVISYPTLNAAGVEQHQLWGLMLLVLTLRGPGRISIDYFVRKKYFG